MPSKLVFFDLDHCLITCNLSEALFSILIKQKLMPKVTKLGMAFLKVLDGLDTHVNIEDIFKVAYSTCKGVECSFFETAAKKLVSEHLSSLLRPEMLSLLNWHKAQGDTVVLLSCSTEYLVQRVAQQLNIEYVFSLVQENVEGRFTGEISGIYNASQKVQKMCSLSAQLSLSLSNAIFYTDAFEDRLPLELVGHPIAAFPDRSLRQYAKEKKWLIIADRASAHRATLPKVLILTSSREGHYAVSKAIQAELLQRLCDFQGQLLCDPVILKNEEAFFGFPHLINLYHYIEQNNPGVYGVCHELLNELSNSEDKDFPSLFYPSYQKVLAKYAPVAIICVDPFSLDCAEYIKGKAPSTTVITCVTDWFGGALKAWGNKIADLIYFPSQRSADYFAKAGIEPHKIVVGNCIIPHAPDTSKISSKESIREILKLHPRFHTILFNTYGTLDTLPLLESLSSYILPLQVIVLCQGNQLVEDAVIKLSKRSSIHLHPILWTDEMSKALHASDFVFTKPDSTLCAEAIAWKCGILINAMQPTIPQEKEVADFLELNQLATVIPHIDTWKEAISLICEAQGPLAAIKQKVVNFKIENGLEEFAALVAKQILPLKK